MASIGDVFFSFRGDDQQLQVDAAKAGDAAGKTLGDRLGLTAANGLKVAGAALLAVTGIAAKGGLDLSNAMAKFRAETGATDQEAEEAQKTLVDLYKTNKDGFATLGDVLAVVHNDMGLVGQDAKDMTQFVLDFAHATGIDAVQAAHALDDATDAYNLTNQQQKDLLDKLIVSHQTYGGSVQDNLQVLINLAPALRAANLSYDQGIGLLNLFEKAGVDASKAPQALAHALNLVHSPDELQQLIRDIAATEDPTQRETKAVDLFGIRAGPQLALALAQGSGALDEFTPKTDAAAGATEKAAANAQTLSDKLKTFFHSVTADADNFFTTIHPIAGTFGALAEGLTALEIGEKGWTREKIASTAASKAQLIAEKAKAIVYALQNPEIAKQNIQMAAGTVLRIASTVATLAWAAATGLATLAVTALRVAISILFGPIGLIILAVGLLFAAWQTNFLGIRDIVGGAVKLIGDSLNFLLGIVGAVADGIGKAFKFVGDLIGAIGSLAGAVVNVMSGARDGVGKAKDDIVGDLTKGKDDVYAGAATMASGIPEGIASQDGPTSEATQSLVQGATKVIDVEGRLWAEEARKAATSIGAEIRSEGPAGARAMASVMLQAAGAIRDKRDAISSALDQLRTDVKNHMSRTAEIGKLTGELLSKDLAGALKSNDPEVVKQAEGTRDLIEARLLELGAKTGSAGTKAAEELQKALGSKDADIQAQAERTKSLFDSGIQQNTGPKSPGDAVGDQLASDLGSKGRIVGQVAYELGRTIYSNLRAGVLGTIAPGSQVTETTTGVVGSGPGGTPNSYLSGIDRVPYDQMAFIHQDEAVLNPEQADVFRSEGLAGSGGDIHVGPVYISGVGDDVSDGAARRFGQRVMDEVARGLRSQTGRGILEPAL